MNKLLLKRHYKSLIIFIVLVGIAIFFGQTRIMSYNFGTYFTKTKISDNNIENQIDIFDKTIKHNISLNISEDDYKYLLEYYLNNTEKVYIKSNIEIDGTTINDVGIKLKGNKIIEILESQDLSEIVFSFVIKFDKYIEGQQYLGNYELGLISGTDSDLISGIVSEDIFEKYGIKAPNTSFAEINLSEFLEGDFLIQQKVQDNFILENYKSSNSIIYKALNGISFTYLGEDPVEYIDIFEQKSQVNNYDLKKLIEILDFVSNSSDENFEAQFDQYINLDNYINYLAITEIFSGDSNLPLLENYYIYYDTITEKIIFIPGSQRYFTDYLDTSNYEILLKYYSKKQIQDFSKKDVRELLDTLSQRKTQDLKQKYTNDLKKRFLDNNKFKKLYEENISKIETSLEEDDLIEKLEKQYTNILN